MILSVKDLSFAYGDRTVLDAMDFCLQRGELLAILGPNGVGKTTLLKCINAIHAPASGTVQVHGREVLSLPPRRIAQTIGYVAQKNESTRLTVFDAVLMGRKPHLSWRVSESDLKKTEAAIRRLGLGALSLRFIDQLSGGELQQVAMARALVQEPRLLLLDEPTSSLDLKNQITILSLIRRVVDEHHIGAVMTMHDLNTALRFADKFLFLKQGRIHALGPVGDVTAELVAEVYGLPVALHSVDGHPVVVPTA